MMQLMELLWDPRLDESLIVIDILDLRSGEVLESISGSWYDEDVVRCSENSVESFEYIKEDDVLFVKILNDN